MNEEAIVIESLNLLASHLEKGIIPNLEDPIQSLRASLHIELGNEDRISQAGYSSRDIFVLL